jgi:hypothetical protein
MTRLAWLVVPVLVACGVEHGINVGLPSGPYIDGFNPPPVQAGMTRFITPVIKDIQPGDDQLWCQWIQAPQDHDLDLVAFVGQQSKWGHHVVLYANSLVEPVGTSRICTNGDMLTVRYLAAVGGEGTSIVTMPPNVVMRLPAGQAVMANVHFINAGTTTIEGQAVLDVNFQPPDPSRQVAGFLTDLNTQFTVPANTVGTADVSCVAPKDMQFFLFADHMHGYGSSIFTELIRAGDGSTMTLARDNIWQPEFMFNPTFSQWPLNAAATIKAGDTIHTHCEWNNTTTSALTFPGEMCVGLGFYLPGDGPDEICADGSW